MATVIKPNGDVEIVPLDKSRTLRHLYELIGCDMVEIVYLPEDVQMIVDESGAIKFGNVVNALASQVYGSYIFGTVVVLAGDEKLD